MRATLLATLAALLLVTACASREELLPKSAVTPTGVDLSGTWQLRAENGDTLRRISEARREAAGDGQGIVLPPKGTQSQTRKTSSDGTSVHVFLETGSTLKVSQTDFGLFISFDRAVVEEYRFGEKRETNVGPIVADRVSGWDGDVYVIETLDDDGAKLIETYRLDVADGSLVRTITIVHDGVSEVDVDQVFDRI